MSNSLVLVSITTICKSQTNSEPLELVKKYFNNELRNYKSVLIGEAKKQNFSPAKIENMKLTVSSDEDLTNHFIKNKQQFENILEKKLSNSIYVNKRELLKTMSSKLFEILKLEFTVVNENGEAHSRGVNELNY